MNNSNISYDNNPTQRAKSRIMYDIDNIKNSYNELIKEGLYFKFNISDTFDTKYQMLIIGPDDSPYVGGYYFFDCKFPDKYPYFPMKIISKTQGGGIRKHPNLYVSGKCCFSFLGTWQGPPWTACLNPKTAGISIRSVLTNNPITNEPGWQNKNNSLTKLYEDIIRFFNIKYGVINILENIESSNLINYFSKDIISLFISNYDKFILELEKIQHLHLSNTKSPVYNFSVEINCDELRDKLLKLKEKFSGTKINNYEIVPNQDIVNDNIIDESSTSNIEIKKEKKTEIVQNYKRKCPKKSSNLFDAGYIEKGLDQREYIVKLLTNGKKKWVLHK